MGTFKTVRFRAALCRRRFEKLIDCFAGQDVASRQGVVFLNWPFLYGPLLNH